MILMGDLVNGISELHTQRLLREVSVICEAFKERTYYMHGNHDLDFMSKAQFFNAVGRAGDPSCFHFKIGGHQIFCIDGSFSLDGTAYECGNFEWQEAFVPAEQLDWLQGQLDESVLPAIVISHQRIDSECTHAVRNHAAVQNVISTSDKVLAVFQGHNHEEDLQKIENVPYYTLAAHKDGVGPAVIELDVKGIRLIRDFEPHEMDSSDETKSA